MKVLREDQVMGYYLADELADAVNWILGPGWMTKFYPASEPSTATGVSPLFNPMTTATRWAMSYPH
jgi:hypothetical protein